MAVPYSFGSATSAIPLSQLDSNFATVITLGNTAIQLGNTVTTLNNMTLANVTISSGSVTLTSASVTNANVTSTLTLDGGTANGVAYLNTSKVVTTGSALTFDGTNLGIGYSTAYGKLNVNSMAAPASSGNMNSGLVIGNGASGTAINMGTYDSGSTATSYGWISAAYVTNAGITNSLVLQPNGGNLGLGVTPSAWNSGAKVLELGGGTFQTFGTNQIAVNQNFYYNSSAQYIYKTTAAATQYQQIFGEHRFYNAPSGTANTSFTFTQAMTLDASGNLLLGNSSFTNAQKLNVNGVGQFGSYSGNGPAAYVGSNSSGGYIGGYDASNSANNVLAFFAGSTYGEKARIDSSGNFYIANTTFLNGFGAENVSEFMYAGGASGYCAINTKTSNSALYISRTSAATTGGLINFASNGSTVGSISYNGSTTVLNPTSDSRLKENIVDAGSGLEKINAVRIRSFNWKANNNFTDFGVIAQELHEVAPECVLVGGDELNEKGEPKNPWCAQPYVLVPAMIKAIQEQQALIESLTTRLASLESK
jgi:hypothetical protein